MSTLQSLVSVLLIMFLIIPSTFAASPDWGTLAPNNLYKSFWDVSEKEILTSQWSITQSTGLYKKADDTEAQNYSGVMVTGAVKSTEVSLGEYDTQLEAILESGSAKKGMEYNMSVREIGENFYISFPNVRNKELQKKWILVPEDQFKQLGIELGLETLFNSVQLDTSDVTKEVYEKTTALAKKHNLYTRLTTDIDDDYDLPNTTRYDLVLRRDAIAGFYTDLDKQLSAEAKEFTLLGIDGFTKRLKEASFIDYLAENAYESLWIDNTNKLPVQYLSAGSLPPPKNSKTGYVFSFSHAKWDSVNKPVTILKPSVSLSLSEGKKLLGIDPHLAAKEDIKNLSKQASTAKNKIDKGYIYLDIADIYSDFDKKMASSYYKKAAALFKKGSPDYYYSLAEAERELKNGKKVKEIYELALESHPQDDLLLNRYGWFLLGLSPTSIKYQDLAKAQELNSILVKNLVDDSNLQNLYLTYLLLNKSVEAESLKSKFDDFENADNYNLIARAYYRAGNGNMVKKYQLLAKQKGHLQTDADKEFYATKF
jgi:hypothetical protein